MRKVLVFLLLFTPTVCLAYALHIGNVSIPVHSEKYTTPSYNIKTEFGDIYHIPMTPQNISGTLHAMTDDGTIYSACVGSTKTQVGYYYFIGNCLVGIENNVYLESTGTQYIKTNLSTPNGVRAIFRVKNNTDEEYNYIWGSHGNVSPYGRNYFEFDPDGVGEVGAGAYYLTDHNIFNLNDVYDIDMATFVNGTYLDVNNSSVSIQISGVPTDWRASDNLRLFGVARGNSSSTAKARLYHIIFMNENNQTMAHFVPVPAGMRIGNYTVPSNGMWDVVEQKFYGNDGTGDFIYGVDQPSCVGQETNVGHYRFIGDCLVGVDSDVYLKIQNDETNGYWNNINTDVSWLDSDRVEFTVGYNHSETPPSGYENNAMFFATFGTGSNYISYSKDDFYTRNNTTPQIISISPNIQMTQFKQLPKETFDIEYTTTVDGDIHFGSWSDRQWSRTMKWYGVNIYDGNTLLRQFVPVPSGMQIGNYITPSNGMWDVVKQQFYGNAGSGEFIYGVDE